MRKLIIWNIITLDGYFEGKQNWDLPRSGRHLFRQVIASKNLSLISSALAV